MCEGFLHDGECSTPTGCLNSFSNICTACDESLLLVNNTCVACPVEHCDRCTNTTCLKCADAYRADADGTACLPVVDPVVFSMSEVELKCVAGASPISGRCETCGGDECVACTAAGCSVCTASMQDGAGGCVRPENSAVVVHRSVVSCADGAFHDGTGCTLCADRFGPACTQCTAEACLACSGGVSHGDTCYSCETHQGVCTCGPGQFLTSTCVDCDEGCAACDADGCAVCDEGLFFKQTQCGSRAADVEAYNGNGAPTRCVAGTFLDADGGCAPCVGCQTCLDAATCLSCNETSVLLSGACVSRDEAMVSCQKLNPSGEGCAICKTGFFRNGTECVACEAACVRCTMDGCSQCAAEFWLDQNLTACRPYSALAHCTAPTQAGCTACDDGFFVQSQVCVGCSAHTPRCTRCDAQTCRSCASGHVLVGGACVDFNSIESCTAAGDSKCTACAFWHAPNANGTACETRVVWWVIALAVVVVLVLLLVVFIIVAVVVKVVIRAMHKKDVEKRTCIFDMSRSNVAFVSLGDGIEVSSKAVRFDEKLPVDVEARELFCVGNAGKRRVKVQLLANQKSAEKAGVRVEPAAAMLERGMACEFEVFATPHCSCRFREEMAVLSKCGTGRTVSKKVAVEFDTEVSSKLHYDDVACEKQIGEGSFGVVFKGSYRGNDVAIKKMKEVGVSADSLDEFAKEVAMLDKFRCDQIVHFYGACFIPNHIMMVTEFAPCGSLADCIVKRPEPSEQIKAKLMLDAAKGLEYLHANGVLHRDVKPDNVLVFSLDEELAVNGKLTDFGSSRNVNMLMTNMTFTKGVGSPTYMAPEVLNKEKYKKAADVFSFGVMMFECFKWGEAYPKAQFKFPWQISTFVQAGKRAGKPAEMPGAVYDIVSACWAHDPKDRIGLFSSR